MWRWLMLSRTSNLKLSDYGRCIGRINQQIIKSGRITKHSPR